MALLPDNPRDQKLVVAILMALGLAVVYQRLVWSPKSAELHALDARLDTLDSLNRLAKAEVGKDGGGATPRKRDAAMPSRELIELRRLLPVAKEMPGLLESVSIAARQAGVTLSEVTPDGIVTGDQFDTYRYKLGVTGTYSNVADLLAQVGSLPHIVAPINLSLAPTSRPGESKPKTGQLLDARFQIQTYVAHSAPAPAAISVATGPPPRVMREELELTMDERRDPFLSPLTTNALRPAMGDLRLTGVLYEPSGRRSVATLRDLVSNAPYRVSVGSLLGRMRVSAIHAKAVIFAIDEFGARRRDSLVLGDSTKARAR